VCRHDAWALLQAVHGYVATQVLDSGYAALLAQTMAYGDSPSALAGLHAAHVDGVGRRLFIADDDAAARSRGSDMVARASHVLHGAFDAVDDFADRFDWLVGVAGDGRSRDDAGGTAGDLARGGAALARAAAAVRHAHAALSDRVAVLVRGLRLLSAQSGGFTPVDDLLARLDVRGR